MTTFHADPDRYAQFRDHASRFRLVTTAERVADFRLAPSTWYADARVVGLDDGEPLEAAFLDGRCPPGSDVLAVCPGQFLTSPSEDSLGDRRLSILPCGSTPVVDEDIAYFLEVTERSAPDALAGAAERLFAAFERSPEVTLTAATDATVATFRPSEDYEWNLQAGYLEPGEQQIAPAGEASALPTDIFDFDRSRRLGVDGRVVLRGTPIVHRGEKSDPDEQAALFAELGVLTTSAVALDVVAGEVTDAVAMTHDAEPAAAALRALYDRDPSYRIVWEFGVGLNPHVELRPRNCGMNEVYGQGNGVLHLGFGLTPATEFALTFPCVGTVLTEPTGAVICGTGAAPAPRRRLNVRRSASCGCH